MSKTQKEGWQGGYQIRSNCESGHQASNLQPFGPQPSNLSLHQELLGKPSQRQNIFQRVQTLHLSLQFSHDCRLLLLTLLANGLSGHNSNLFKCHLPTPTWLCRLEVEPLSSQICEQSCWLDYNHRQLWSLDRIRNCLIQLDMKNHKDCHFKLQNHCWDTLVIRGQCENYFSH